MAQKITEKYRRKMNVSDKMEVLPMEFETVPPQKKSIKAKKPKIDIELWRDGDEFISIKLEGPNKTVENKKVEEEQSK